MIRAYSWIYAQTTTGKAKGVPGIESGLATFKANSPHIVLGPDYYKRLQM